MDVQIDSSWKTTLQPEFEKSYFAIIKEKLDEEVKNNVIYPPEPLWFNAFSATPFDQLKVVILWQDPYHGAGQAMGLSFSVPVWVPLPPSLKNMYKELQDDLGHSISSTGDLTSWARQWVLLLNAFLTVRAWVPASHQWFGREYFTDAVIRTVSEKKEHVVFMLWGNFAKSKRSLIDTNKHLVLEAAHPSPFSAYNGFFGCKHFSRTNEYLQDNWIQPIDWKISSPNKLF